MLVIHAFIKNHLDTVDTTKFRRKLGYGKKDSKLWAEVETSCRRFLAAYITVAGLRGSQIRNDGQLQRMAMNEMVDTFLSKEGFGDRFWPGDPENLYYSGLVHRGTPVTHLVLPKTAATTKRNDTTPESPLRGRDPAYGWAVSSLMDLESREYQAASLEYDQPVHNIAPIRTEPDTIDEAPQSPKNLVGSDVVTANHNNSDATLASDVVKANAPTSQTENLLVRDKELWVDSWSQEHLRPLLDGDAQLHQHSPPPPATPDRAKTKHMVIRDSISAPGTEDKSRQRRKPRNTPESTHRSRKRLKNAEDEQPPRRQSARLAHKSQQHLNPREKTHSEPSLPLLAQKTNNQDIFMEPAPESAPTGSSNEAQSHHQMAHQYVQQPGYGQGQMDPHGGGYQQGPIAPPATFGTGGIATQSSAGYAPVQNWNSAAPQSQPPVSGASWAGHVPVSHRHPYDSQGRYGAPVPSQQLRNPLGHNYSQTAAFQYAMASQQFQQQQKQQQQKQQQQFQQQQFQQQQFQQPQFQQQFQQHQ
ncbi:hypothetical protein NLG97_g2479 [Lecanicillium saksenae]|uniref:Uncharacterized protein n=1 Tax=Lecanicillium saksenae TaxID=468837 RepID=A0ACC1R2M4_9HYPO|nr:hypothetical protein NLG97_g2479 [Lecanicillium saksenae]